MEKTEEIYGMRVVPEYDHNNLLYGGFDGVVISSDIGGSNIHISKMRKTESGGYFSDSSTPIPYEEIREHNQTSGKSLADFLCLKALELFDGLDHNKIAISHQLAGHLLLLDESWERFKEVLAQGR